MRYQIKTKDGSISSNFSNTNYFFTKRNSEVNNLINLYIRGTGRNNHDNAIVKLNDMVILKHGLYQGLALVVLNRFNLAVEKINFYDTFNDAPSNNSEYTFTKYSYDSDGNLITQTQTETFTNFNNLSISNSLVYDLLQLDETKIVILVSCYGWEKNFSPELADILAKYGGLNILEFKFITEVDEDSLENLSLINKHNYYHPFAMVGIPNIGPAGGYESIRTNKGHYLSTANLPQAELLIKWKFNNYARNYYFDEIQYKEKFNYADDYDYLFNSRDYSLKNLFPFILYTNTTTNINYGFFIYNQGKNEEVRIPNSGPYTSELDRVVAGSNLVERVFLNGTVLQSGIVVKNLNYYNFFYSAGILQTECLPPYTATPECPFATLIDTPISNPIPILKCKVGLAPQVCLTNQNYQYLFTGYN